ncbi:uncharacterized protein VTP21DRAFT_7529 [Calcarisporiella thermophila]|uniref:uncharacterized protein n=1 Tax=Calcarisporiella thermophila TaxID=911321 RepID=UPI0037430F4E
MHDAFQVSTALDKLPVKIESIFAYGDRLLVGTANGQLYVYEVKEPLVVGDDVEVSVTLLETKKSFSRRPIEQMDIIKEIDALVSLSDGLISLHDLRTLTLRNHLTKTRGANIFCLNTCVEMSETDGIPQLITRLFVAVRKKLIIFIWKDSEFSDTKELPLPDRVRAMAWVGSGKICLGFTSDYALLDINTGNIKDLLTPPPTHDTSTALGTWNTLYANVSSFGTRYSKPLITRLPNNEILLAKENVSIFVGLDGTPTRKEGIEWSEPPEIMGYSYPYLVAILPRHIEVRNIASQTLVQIIELPQARLLNQGKLLYIGSSTQLSRLTPYSFAHQVDQLVEKCEFEEALSLLEQIEPVLFDDKEQKMREIQSRYAHYLFLQKRFDEAILIFQELETDPSEVIALYPETIAGSLASAKPNGAQADDKRDAETSETPDSDGTEEEGRDLRDQKEDASQHSHSDNETISSPLSEGDLKEATQYLIRFLTDRRQKVYKALQQREHQRAEDGSRPVPLASSVSSSGSGMDAKSDEELSAMAQLVDTTLLKAYMMTNEALVGPLLRVQNHCRVDEVEHLLLERKRYRELVDMYNGKGLHRKALDLLKEIGQSGEGPLRGIWPTVSYLQRLDSEHLDLILEYSTWVLEVDPENGMQIFMDEYPGVEELPRERVLEHLETFSLDLSIQYLEYIIHNLGDETPDLHNRLISSYLAKMQEHGELDGQAHYEEMSSERRKLLLFLEQSTYYRAERVLSQLPIDGLYHERAILLSRIGQHDQALNIYVHKLNDPGMAEDYCNRHYDPEDEQTRDVYLSLLRVYLLPAQGHSPKIEDAVQLLSRHGSQVNALEAMRLLPLQIRISELYPFFEKYIRETNKNYRANQVVLNLLRAEQVQIREQLVYYRSRAVKITEDRMCPQCTKRIGNSAFVVFPNGAVVHYSCKEKLEREREWAMTRM